MSPAFVARLSLTVCACPRLSPSALCPTLCVQSLVLSPSVPPRVPVHACSPREFLLGNEGRGADCKCTHRSVHGFTVACPSR